MNKAWAMAVLVLFFARGLCLADTPALARLKAENLNLENRLQKTLRENSGLKGRLISLQREKMGLSKAGPGQGSPAEVKLRKKLVDAEMELVATKNKDENLKQEVANMHYNLGVIFQGQGKYEAAIKEFKSDLTLNPGDADACYNLALIYDRVKNERARAIDHYKMYLRIRPFAADTLKVKERLTQLGAEQKIWGNPAAENINEKQGLGRL